MLNTKITYSLAEWIRDWIKNRKESPSLDNCYKFVEWKLEGSKLTESDKIQIEAILLYEISD
tara:strand:+ start:3220 stop:3405 length:186 start_codon:yes stop_codon:yes gene_type:complete